MAGFLIEMKDGMNYLSGVLDEFADFSPLAKQDEPLRINFRNVQRINSIGLRTFLRFLRQWSDRSLEYYDCPIDLVQQMAVVSGLMGTHDQAVVKSFFATYECENCDREEVLLCQHDDLKETNETGEFPAFKCPNCQSAMKVCFETFQHVLP